LSSETRSRCRNAAPWILTLLHRTAIAYQPCRRAAPARPRETFASSMPVSARAEAAPRTARHQSTAACRCDRGLLSADPEIRIRRKSYLAEPPLFFRPGTRGSGRLVLRRLAATHDGQGADHPSSARTSKPRNRVGGRSLLPARTGAPPRRLSSDPVRRRNPELGPF
jgi:hypothetical protein